MKKVLYSFCLCLFLSGFFNLASAQYARLTFFSDDNQPFQVRANGKNLSEGMATHLRVRVNRKNQYRFEIYTPGSKKAVVEKSVKINPALISTSYVLKKNKKGEFVLKTRNTRMEEMASADGGGQKKSKGIEYSYETHETSAGPDGVTSKSSKGSGTLNGDGFSSKSTKSSSSMNDKGFNMSSETKERGVNAAETMGTLGQLGKLAKGKKKKGKAEEADGRDLVVEEVQLAPDAQPEAMEAKVATEAPKNAAKPEKEPAPTKTFAEAKPAAAAEPTKVTFADQPVMDAPAPPPPGDGEAISIVESEHGFEFYVMSEPEKEYEVLFEVEAGMTGEMLAKKERGFKNVMDGLAGQVQKMKLKKKYKDAQVDAIITVMGREGKAVRFTGGPQGAYAKVQDYDGVQIYMVAKPTRPFKVVHEFTNTSAMLGKPNIWARTQRAIRTVKKENPDLKFDAVQSADGILYQFIQFQ